MKQHQNFNRILNSKKRRGCAPSPKLSVICLPTKGLCRVKLRRDSDSDSRSGMESESTESYPASTTIIIQQSLRLVIIHSGTQNSRAQRQYIQTTHNQHIVSICSNTQQHSRLSYTQPASTKPAHIQPAHAAARTWINKVAI